ncbi:MAG: YIP1 family protein [Pseudomonadota bacterium]
MDGDAVTTARSPFLLWQIFGAWGDLRASFRALMATSPGEPRLLFIAMLSSLIYFLGTMVAESIAPSAVRSEEEMRGFVAANLITALFFRTLALYGVGALACIIMRRFGGTGGWFESRAATFWAMLIAAPVAFALTVIAAIAGPGMSPGHAAALGEAGGIITAVVLAFCLAEAHGFRRAWPVLLGMIAISVAALLLVRGLQLAIGGGA